MSQKMSKREKTYLTLTSILMAIAGFAGLVLGLMMLYYFLGPMMGK
ncbi:MAG: hypothetical protein SCK29_03205 [Bacillota bacterium]|nr:hypothetical protein [Bacillota bacterium]MDW7683112.1 hypothetical protein [Bacillota bacterium]